MSRVLLQLSRPPSPQVDAAVKLETKKLLAKGAIEMVHDPSSPGFYSRLFLMDKRDGGYRPVIDLSSLNQHLESSSFKMETSSIMAALRRGMDNVHRPEGCILPHSSSKVLEEVSLIRNGKRGLPVQGSALWSGDCPHDIYEGHECGSSLCTRSVDKGTYVPG